jgi:hypothetical protein
MLELKALDHTNAPEGSRAALETVVKKPGVEKRGWVEETDVDAFIDAGFEPARVLDVLTAVSMKMVSNYTNHIAEPALDKPLQKFAWQAPRARTPASSISLKAAQ